MYTLFFQLHQARQLSPMDETGLSDPYVIMHCGGKTIRSSTVSQSLSPHWHLCYVLSVNLIMPLEYSPPILIRVY